MHQGVLFDNGGRSGPDGFGKRQDAALQFAKRVLDLTRFEL
jgi:hypothetical protein